MEKHMWGFLEVMIGDFVMTRCGVSFVTNGMGDVLEGDGSCQWVVRKCVILIWL